MGPAGLDFLRQLAREFSGDEEKQIAFYVRGHLGMLLRSPKWQRSHPNDGNVAHVWQVVIGTACHPSLTLTVFPALPPPSSPAPPDSAASRWRSVRLILIRVE